MSFAMIDTSIWENKKFNNLSIEARTFYIFLLTAPGRKNSIGLFPLGIGSVTDFKCFEDYSKKDILNLFKELEENNLAFYNDGWVYFHNYLKWNPVGSYKHAIGISEQINEAAKKNAPAEALCNVLRSVKAAIGEKKYKNDKTETLVFEAFKNNLDWNELIEILGSKRAVEDCLNGIKCPNPSKTDRGMDRGIDTHTIGYAKATDTHTIGIAYASDIQKQYNTDTIQDRDNTDKVLSRSNKYNSEIEIKIVFADAQLRPIGSAAIGLVMQKLGYDIDETRRAIQSYNLTHPTGRPSSLKDCLPYAQTIIESELSKQGESNG